MKIMMFDIFATYAIVGLLVGLLIVYLSVIVRYDIHVRRRNSQRGLAPDYDRKLDELCSHLERKK